MNDLQIFSSPAFGKIRTQMSARGEPLFCLASVSSNRGNPTQRKIPRLGA